jgi:carboxyl-terminal processing protease
MFVAMKRKIFLLLIVFAALVNRALIWRGIGAETEAGDDAGYANIAVFTRALQLIRQDYVDSKKISYRELVYGALKGMLATLDPHSAFMEPQDFSSMQDDTKGDFGGLGVVVAMKDGVLTIVSPMEGTPGFKAGLMPGDQILKINGTSTEQMDLAEAVSLLRGEVGQSVTLTILRPSTKDIKDYVIERAVIKVESVRGTKLLDPTLSGDRKIGYVRITQFNAPTGEELAKALDELEAQGMEALVLDLRYNPGGLLNSAVDVCAQFLPPREMVVYTEGRSPSQRRVYRTPDDYKPRPNYPIAILINNGSASGSEIVAGALKDLNRAVLVGETTFGKGSVQSVMELQDGSALRFTTAKYYTPSKQVIHEHGVTPHLRVTLTPRQERAVLLLRRDEGMDPELREELEEFKDPQMERAIDALKGVLTFNDRGNGTPVKKVSAKK